MLSKVIASSFIGVEGYIIDVEVFVSNGLPSFSIVGLGDAAIIESKERVRAALKNSDFTISPRKIVVNLSPASLRKEGTCFDLAIALGILGSYNLIDPQLLSETMFIGELSLDGSLKKTKGILNAVINAKENGIKRIVVPYQNYNEARIINEIEIIPGKDLKNCVDILNGLEKPDYNIKLDEIEEDNFLIDFSEVKGQYKAKRAAEIAAAGGHNLLMNGTPGSGKSMISKRICTILPKMTEEEIIETTKLYSISGLLNDNSVIKRRPFRSPHHTSSDVSLIGGGRNPKPGEISLAHNGVLFLDEMTEFSKNVLEVLRQPLEDRKVSISRASFSVEFPCDFILIGSNNPCFCGFLYENSCTCTPAEVQRYQKKLSGPIIDRMDLYVEVRKISEDELLDKSSAERSKQIKNRVEKARKLQNRRYENSRKNSNLTQKEMKKHCKLDASSEEILKKAIQNLGITGRGYDKILRVSRTIADLAGEKNIKREHIMEAVSYRMW